MRSEPKHYIGETIRDTYNEQAVKVIGVDIWINPPTYLVKPVNPEKESYFLSEPLTEKLMPEEAYEDL